VSTKIISTTVINKAAKISLTLDLTTPSKVAMAAAELVFQFLEPMAMLLPA